MFGRFLIFAMLFVSAAATWTAIAAIIVSETIDPARIFTPRYVHEAVFFIAAVPMLLLAYPIHRGYVFERYGWSVGNLLIYFCVTLLLMTLVFLAFVHGIANRYATVTTAFPLYLLFSIAALWLGGRIALK